MMPWMLLGDYSAYIFGWLVGYSGLLGPIAGVMIVDYFVVRRRELVVEDLYLCHRSYEYSGGGQLSRAAGFGMRDRRWRCWAW
jgi:NCS1 family nucleobase:cation symporter-1